MLRKWPRSTSNRGGQPGRIHRPRTQKLKSLLLRIQSYKVRLVEACRYIALCASPAARNGVFLILSPRLIQLHLFQSSSDINWREQWLWFLLISWWILFLFDMTLYIVALCEEMVHVWFVLPWPIQLHLLQSSLDVKWREQWLWLLPIIWWILFLSDMTLYIALCVSHAARNGACLICASLALSTSPFPILFRYKITWTVSLTFTHNVMNCLSFWYDTVHSTACFACC